MLVAKIIIIISLRVERGPKTHKMMPVECGCHTHGCSMKYMNSTNVQKAPHLPSQGVLKVKNPSYSYIIDFFQ